MERYVTLRLLAIVFLVLSITVSLYAAETSSSSFQIELLSFAQGGGASSSTNFSADYTLVGEWFGYPQQLLSTKLGLYAGQLFMFLFPAPGEEMRWLISDLTARTEILGPLIPPASWQQDNDPYFHWSIITEPPTRIQGFSTSLDIPPDSEIDTLDTHYQFSTDYILSGEHRFFVLPFVSGGVAEEESMLAFDIWVDVDLPVINHLSPAAGALITDNRSPLSCYVTDAHAGLNLDLTTFTLNGELVNFSYDPQTQLLEFTPLTDLAEGENTALLKAFDLVGNNLVKGWDFIVDTQPPAGGILLNGGQEVTHSAFVFIEVEASDSVSGIESMYISNDGVFDTELNHPYAYAAIIENWLVSEPDVDGLKTVFVKFQDKAKNLSAAYSDTITLRLLTPDTRIISGPPGITKESTADFTYEATRSGCQFSYKLDDSDWSGWSASSAAHFSGLAQGNHYFYVKSGFDLNGDGSITVNEADPTPAQWVWTVSEEGMLEKLKERILFWRR